MKAFLRRFTALFLLGVALLASSGCGGGGSSAAGAGVSNGTIAGSVFGIVGGIGGLTPLSGVQVTATRVDGGNPLIRTGSSDSTGGYTLFNVPLGTWDLSYQRNGFSLAGGGSSPIRTFVSSGSLAAVQDVVLNQTTGVGGGSVQIFLVNGSTGSPVLGATVTVGGFPPSFTGNDGSYFFDVPSSGSSLPISVFHPGLAGSTPTPSQVTPVAGFPVTLTVQLGSSSSFVRGTLQASSFNSLYASSGAIGTISISSPQLSQSFLDPVLDPTTGLFSVRVPATTSGGSQFVDLLFTSPFFSQAQVSGILTPGPGGTGNLSSPVVLQPRTSTIQGSVVNSSGFGPTGIPNQIVVVETGQQATLVNGNYTLTGVPAGVDLTLQATTLANPVGVETGVLFLTPLPGVFNAPLLVTN